MRVYKSTPSRAKRPAIVAEAMAAIESGEGESPLFKVADNHNMTPFRLYTWVNEHDTSMLIADPWLNRLVDRAKDLVHWHKPHILQRLATEFGIDNVSKWLSFYDGFSVQDYRKSCCVEHPRFQEWWEKHQKLIYWWGNRLRHDHQLQTLTRQQLDDCDLLGPLTIRMNDSLYGYDPNLSEYTTYYGSNMVSSMVRQVSADRQDTEASRISWHNRVNGGELDIKVIYFEHIEERDKDKILLEYHQSREERTLRDIIFEYFDSEDDFWSYVCYGMNEVDREMFLLYYKGDMTLGEVGKLYKLTRERIRQRVVRALRRVQKRFGEFERWVSGGDSDRPVLDAAVSRVTMAL